MFIMRAYSLFRFVLIN